MKTIIYNDDNLQENEINRLSQRAKAIIKNDNDEILLACSNFNYHLPGGHLEKDESFEDCLAREIKEEVGVDIPKVTNEPILSIIYYNRDYPMKGTNSKTEARYYEINYEVVPDYKKIKLTDDEINGNFKLEYIKVDNIIKYLEKSLETCTREGVVKDTIEALKEYINNRGEQYESNILQR